MKKTLLVSLTLSLLVGSLISCGKKNTSSATNNSINDSSISGESDCSSIDILSGESISALPEEVKVPDKPNLPNLDETKNPYIGKIGTTSEAYDVQGIKESDTLVGASISYPSVGKTLQDNNFVYFDIYNYTSEYNNIRFDFDSINGCESVSVACMYMEAYESNKPAVGILSENLMDGEMSYVSTLSDHKTIDANYNQEEQSLQDMTICRLYVYLDSNPSYTIQDKEGSLNIKKISFLKDGDPNLKVDNTPKIRSINASDEYNITKNEDIVFKAEYVVSELTVSSNVCVEIDRFVGAYGTLNIGYEATLAKNLIVAVNNKEIATYSLIDKGNISVDLREIKKISDIKFYIDTKDSGDNTETRTITITSLNFVYTPYVTDSWSATSKFWLGEHNIGGKIVATYEQSVGWDFISANVKYWNSDYSLMTIKAKISGSDENSIPERFGLSINSNFVLLEVENNTFAGLPYDELTKEYTINVDLSKIKKLSALNFYFDSVLFTPFAGTRTVEFTSITFNKPQEAIEDTKIGAMEDPYNCNYTINNNTDGWNNVIWNKENKQEWGKTATLVSLYKSEYKYLKVDIETDNSFTLGIYKSERWSSTEIQLKAHTFVDSGSTTWYIEMINDLSSSFELRYFFDAGKSNTSGNVNIKAEFIKELPSNTSMKVNDLVDMNNEGYQISKGEDGSFNIVWDESRISTWAKAKMAVEAFDKEFKYIQVSFVSEKSNLVGLYVNDEALKVHTALNIGNDKWIIKVPETFEENFDMIFYFDGGKESSGNITMNVEFYKTCPDSSYFDREIDDLENWD